MSDWSFEPGIAIPLAVPALLYGLGGRARRASTTQRKFLFWSGWLVLVFALLSPLHELSESLFSAHMLQHEILMLAAAPLLVLSRPLAPMLHGMPFEWRRTLGRWSKAGLVAAVWHGVTKPLAAWWIHAAALWIWHYPPLFDATLGNEWIHAAQHLSFLGSALLFWWALFYARRRAAQGTSVLYVFTTAVHTGILGALLTLSTRTWYPAYAGSTAAYGVTPLEDQQIGGLIMWVPAGLVYLGAGLTLFAKWLVPSRAAALTTVLLAMVAGGCGADSARYAATAETGGNPEAGMRAVSQYGCGACHTIPDVAGAQGRVGPPLAGIGARLYVAGELPNTPENLMHWIRHPHSVNEHTLMPETGVTEQDARDIAALLYTFK